MNHHKAKTKMSNQILITILPQNSVTTKNISFNSDYILITEVSGDSTIFSTVSYFDDPKNPTNPTNVFNSTQTVEQIVAASNNSLVQATVYYQGSFALESALKMAFPVGGYQISPVSGTTNVNSAIRYRGNTYSAQETVAVLSNSANITTNGAVITSALTPITSSTLADVAGMSVSVNANSKYNLKIVIRAACSTANGINFAITAPVGSAIGGGDWKITSTSTSGLQMIPFTIGSATTVAAVRIAGGGSGTIELDTYIVTGSTSGTLQLQMASATNGDSSTFNSGGMHITYLGAV